MRNKHLNVQKADFECLITFSRGSSALPWRRADDRTLNRMFIRRVEYSERFSQAVKGGGPVCDDRSNAWLGQEVAAWVDADEPTYSKNFEEVSCLYFCKICIRFSSGP